MHAQIKDLWISALESGEYEQCRGAMTAGGNRYCALGVLSMIARQKGGIGAALSLDKWSGMVPDRDFGMVVNWNDEEMLSFHEIAIKIKEEF